MYEIHVRLMVYCNDYPRLFASQFLQCMFNSLIRSCLLKFSIAPTTSIIDLAYHIFYLFSKINIAETVKLKKTMAATADWHKQHKHRQCQLRIGGGFPFEKLVCSVFKHIITHNIMSREGTVGNHKIWLKIILQH